MKEKETPPKESGGPEQYLPPTDRALKAFVDIIQILKPHDFPTRIRILRAVNVLMNIEL